MITPLCARLDSSVEIVAMLWICSYVAPPHCPALATKIRLLVPTRNHRLEEKRPRDQEVEN